MHIENFTEVNNVFQDYAENFNIEYDGKSPCENDTLLCYKDREILCGYDENNRVVLPKFRDIKENINAVFVFSETGKRYFLALDTVASAEGFEYKDINLLKSAVCDKNQFAAITGVHYRSFHDENRFCGRCGERLRHYPEKRCMICESCGNEVFPKISPAVIVGVMDEETDSIVLTKYADRDYKKYALVAGFAEMGESAEDAAKREVMEETGLEITDLKYYRSQPWGFSQNLLMGFFAKVKNSREIKMDETELSEAVWVRREDVPAVPDSISLTGEMMWAFKSRQWGL